MDISVIIPIYNVEQYLKRCVDSVLSQKEITLEIILVDDGSTDSSGKICDDYASKNSNVRCLHVENGGPATAKNKGYDIAKGNYVAFIDSDDEIKQDMFSVMLKSGYQHNADIVCCNYIQIDEEGHISHTNHTNQEFVLNQEQAIKAILLKDKIYSQCWTKIYKRKMLESYHIINPEGLKTDEDFIFNIQAFSYSQTICIVDKPLYIYTHRSKSLSKDYYRNHINQYIDNRILRLDLLESIIHDRFPHLQEFCTYHCIFYYNELIGRICLFPNLYHDKRTHKVISYIRDHSEVLIRYHNMLGFSKIGTLLIRLLPVTTYLLYRRKKA